MRTNLEKWRHYKCLIDEKLNQFLAENFPELPKIFYNVERSGIISTCEVGKFNCNRPYYSGSKPARCDVEKIVNFYQNWNNSFDKEKVFASYKVIHSVGMTYSGGINIIDLKNAYTSIEQATERANQIIKNWEEERAFQQEHAKDKNYNYTGNGYKFLGWQNGWKREEKNPEYDNCREQKHRLIDVSHNRSGSEHTVSCPVCKIYYKYDCSG